MRILQVNYDLMTPGKDYSRLQKRLLDFGAFSPLFSVWLLPKVCGAAALRDDLAQYIDRNDKLLVTEVDAIAWTGLDHNMTARINAWFSELTA